MITNLEKAENLKASILVLQELRDNIEDFNKLDTSFKKLIEAVITSLKRSV